MEWNCLLLFLLLLILPVTGYVEVDVDNLITSLNKLTDQTIMQQMFVEERIRSAGSGFRQTRMRHLGTKSYMSESFTGDKYLALHNHANWYNTVGMGEVEVAMNGVEFRTRHSDYLMQSPSKTSQEFHAVEDIEYPGVPPEVTRKTTVEEQIVEMRKWFKAWKDQDTTERDYRQYFKPILCYMEGAWTHPYDFKEETNFINDRFGLFHAKDWKELHDKVRFSGYAGWKTKYEDLAYLPTKFMEILNETTDYITPIKAQWTYRILCHNIKRDLPPNRFKLVDELQDRMARGLSLEEYRNLNSAHFIINPEDKDIFIDEEYQFGLLDELMLEVPGKDNYNADLRNNIWGKNMAYDIRENGFKELNAGYYHRWYKMKAKDSMGVRERHVGFNDPNIFMAMTTQEKVAGQTIKDDCKIDRVTQERICKKVETQRWTYALPLEIIYLTPLHKWNPYNILYRGSAFRGEGLKVRSGGRTGGRTVKSALDGVNSHGFTMTPSSFFTGHEINMDSADTSRNLYIGVLNRTGDVCICASSGVRMFTPNIPTVGVMRTRYPIGHVDVEGDSTWKELMALRHLIMNSGSYPNSFTGVTKLRNTTLELKMTLSNSTDFFAHIHLVRLTEEEVQMLKVRGDTLEVPTTYHKGHSHSLEIFFNKKATRFEYRSCDGRKEGLLCADGHGAILNTDEIKMS